MPNRSSLLGASSTAVVDPALDALFANSSGPVKARPKSHYTASIPSLVEKNEEPQDIEEASEDGSSSLEHPAPADGDDAGDTSSVDESEGESESDFDPDEGGAQDAAVALASEDAAVDNRVRKRKRDNDADDLESKYLAKNQAKEEGSLKDRQKRHKNQTNGQESASGSSAEDSSDHGNDDAVPQHESLDKDAGSATASEIEKAASTVFISNVSSEAITSKPAKKALLAHLSSVLDTSATPPQRLESLRFRSVAFSTAALPKRAAYITKSLMAATTRSTNAYAVYSSAAAARGAAAKLNGTEVLGRHIRVDSVAHPSPVDHRRCVFVGNLGFVDDETVLNGDKDGEVTAKKRHKTPADVEEGLWRTFGERAGRVESVRVVRDPKTRVGKGFAYVQFYDLNHVEGALLLNNKQFPPMLPRPMRVTRAKDPRKTANAIDKSRAKSAAEPSDGKRGAKYKPKATPEQKSQAGRAGKLLGRAGAARQRLEGRKGPTRPLVRPSDGVVFEGKRASINDGHRVGKKHKKEKPQGRGARRAKKWRQSQASK